VNAVRHLGFAHLAYDMCMPRTLALALLLVGCDAASDPGDLEVQVQTDLLPGFEFTEVRTTLEGADSMSDDPQIVRARTSEHPSYLAGRQVAVYRGVAPSEGGVRVELLAGEDVLLDRRAGFAIPSGGSASITVQMTRDCRSVSCPGAGDSPTASECLSGACVPASCTPQAAATCPVERCSRDSDCDNGGIDCALGRCANGRCLLAADESLCGPTERCDLDLGCVGAPAADAGAPDAGE